jgi:hypothetical protein
MPVERSEKDQNIPTEVDEGQLEDTAVDVQETAEQQEGTGWITDYTGITGEGNFTEFPDFEEAVLAAYTAAEFSGMELAEEIAREFEEETVSYEATADGTLENIFENQARGFMEGRTLVDGDEGPGGVMVSGEGEGEWSTTVDASGDGGMRGDGETIVGGTTGDDERSLLGGFRRELEESGPAGLRSSQPQQASESPSSLSEHQIRNSKENGEGDPTQEQYYFECIFST